MSVRAWLIFVPFLFFIHHTVLAAKPSEPAITAEQTPAVSDFDNFANGSINPLSPPATRSPRDTLREFLDKTTQAINMVNTVEQQAVKEKGLFHTPQHIAQGAYAEELLEQAIRTLNLSDIPEAHRARVGLERALMLKEIFERIPLPEQNTIPDSSAVGDTDKPLQRWEIPGTEIAIVLGVKDQYVDEYLFSPDTVHRIPEFFAQVHNLPPLRQSSLNQYNFYDYYTSTPGHLLPPKWNLWLPDWSKDALYLDQTLWQWMAMGGTLLLLISISMYLIRWHMHAAHDENHSLLDIIVPLLIGLLLWGSHDLIEDVFNITADVFVGVSFLIKSLLFITASWFTYTLLNWLAEKVWETQELNARSIDASLIRTMLRLISVIAAATVIYFGAQSLGIPIAPLLAGFGAMGLAIGIGAQEYFKNVVGGLTLFLDRPVRIGEDCEFGNIRGTVTDIGLRSTRILTLDKTLVIVPNSYFSTANITNLSRRSCRVLRASIGLRYETTHEQLQSIMDNLRHYLDEMPWIENHRVRLEALGDFSLTVGIKADVMTHDLEKFLEHQETLLLKVMEIVAAAGTDLAFPSQTVYLEPQPQKA